MFGSSCVLPFRISGVHSCVPYFYGIKMLEKIHTWKKFNLGQRQVSSRKVHVFSIKCEKNISDQSIKLWKQFHKIKLLCVSLLKADYSPKTPDSLQMYAWSGIVCVLSILFL